MFAQEPFSPRFLFRPDPWVPDYSSSQELPEDESEDETPSPIETIGLESDWSQPIEPSETGRPEKIVFVDGVQRVDFWGWLETEAGSCLAAMASTAVGAVVSTDGDSQITYEEPVRVHRVLAACEGISAPSLQVPFGSQTLVFEGVTSAKPGRDGVADALNHRRADLEHKLAQGLAGTLSPTSLVIVDGRLPRLDVGPQDAPVVGMAKTIRYRWLPPEKHALLPALGAGERTPIFRIPDGSRTRLSWYLRLPFTQPFHQPLAGIVRLETPEIGEADAVVLANRVSYHLPGYASRPEHDPRAPQNLVPISALERQLRHEMGDKLWLRRLIENHLFEAFTQRVAV